MIKVMKIKNTLKTDIPVKICYTLKDIINNDTRLQCTLCVKNKNDKEQNKWTNTHTLKSLR